MNYPIDGGSVEINPGKNFSRSVNFASHGALEVYVKGREGEILGAGRMIGVLHLKDQDNQRVIAIDDPKSDDGEVELLASECSYERLNEVDLDQVVADIESLVPATDYVLSLPGQIELHDPANPPDIG